MLWLVLPHGERVALLKSCVLRGSRVRRRKAMRVESGSDLCGDEVGVEVGLIRVCTEV